MHRPVSVKALCVSIDLIEPSIDQSPHCREELVMRKMRKQGHGSFEAFSEYHFLTCASVNYTRSSPWFDLAHLDTILECRTSNWVQEKVFISLYMWWLSSCMHACYTAGFYWATLSTVTGRSCKSWANWTAYWAAEEVYIAGFNAPLSDIFDGDNDEDYDEYGEGYDSRPFARVTMCARPLTPEEWAKGLNLSHETSHTRRIDHESKKKEARENFLRSRAEARQAHRARVRYLSSHHSSTLSL